MKRITIFAMAILCCAAGHAKEFNVELGGKLTGENFGDAFNADFYTLDARYYFDAVSDSDGPYKEAAFIDPSSSVAVSYSGAELDAADNVSESDNWQLRGRYYNRTHGWYVSAGIGRGESDTRVVPEVTVSALVTPLTPTFDVFDGVASLRRLVITSETDANDKNYALGLGRYIGAHTTLDLSYSRGKTDADTHSLTCFDDLPLNIFSFSEPLAGLRCVPSGFVTHADTKTDRLQVTAKHLGEFAHMPWSLQGAVSYLKSSIETELRFADASLAVAGIPTMLGPEIFGALTPIDSAFSTGIAIPQPKSTTTEGWSSAAEFALYPHKNVGVSITYDYADIEDKQTKTYGVAMEWFINHGFAASLSYTNTGVENSSDDNDAVTFRLSGRF